MIPSQMLKGVLEGCILAVIEAVSYTHLDVYKRQEEFLACAIFGAVFTYTAVRGMSAIEKVATVFSPLILIVAVIAGVVFISQAGGVGPFLNEAGKLGGMGPVSYTHLGSVLTDRSGTGHGVLQDADHGADEVRILGSGKADSPARHGVSL